MKLLKDFTHNVFYCDELKKYILLNRSVVDQKTEYFFKANERKRLKEELEDVSLE